MQLRFTKMHSLGNDFVVIDAVRQDVALGRAGAAWLADRQRGVGCDQVLVVGAGGDGADFNLGIFNADGGESGQCGNGARCVALFLRDSGLSDAASCVVRTRERDLALSLDDSGTASVDMGAPQFAPDAVPFFVAGGDGGDGALHTFKLDLHTHSVRACVLSMGNPHAVLTVTDCDTADVAGIGARLATHAAFPEGANIGFMQVLDRGRIRLRVFERGVGETLACGSGACAAVVAGRLGGLLNETVTVAMPGGEMTARWAGGRKRRNAGVVLSGPAVSVYDGAIAEWEERALP